MKIKFPKLTSAHAIALLSLFLALGSTVYAAAGAINGKTIRKGSIPGNRVKKNSLGGTQVNESSLATVPSATNADHAARADHANGADSATNANHANGADRATNADHAGNADQATNANHANGADHATKADHAGTALTADSTHEADHADAADTANLATNAEQLGHLDASSYQRRCSAGAAVGGVRINIANGHPNPPSDGNFFSCNDQRPTVTEESTGRYRVNFPGLPNDQMALISSTKAAIFFRVRGEGGGEFEVTETLGGGGLTNADTQFTLIVY